MTNRQRLDKTIDDWQKRWRNKNYFGLGFCPLCSGVICSDCLLGGFEGESNCRNFAKSLGLGLLGSNDPEETLRHLLQLRLYLYGGVKRWVE